MTLKQIEKELEKVVKENVKDKDNWYWIMEYYNSNKCTIDFKTHPLKTFLRITMDYYPGKASVYKDICLNLDLIETLKYEGGSDYPEVRGTFVDDFLRKEFSDLEKERW